MLVLVDSGVMEQHRCGEAENAYDFQERKTAAGLLFGRLRVGCDGEMVAALFAFTFSDTLRI